MAINEGKKMIKAKSFKFIKKSKKFLSNLMRTAKRLKKRIDVKLSPDGKTIIYWVVK
jgi:hypothetical protein|tara:strand:+ start:494 stop:664 length:171 start_codon:yes stop_codon:yes gene_type:complete